MVDLNRENIQGFDVREFYVKLAADLKRRGIEVYTNATLEIGENEIAKILVLIPCLVACFPLHRNHYLDDGL